MRSGRSAEAGSGTETSLPEIGAHVEVRRHPAARRMTLRVSRTRRAVIVTLPAQCALAEADTFLKRNLDWVRERLTSVPPAEPFRNGAQIPLRGELHRVVFGAGEAARCGDRGGVERMTTAAGPFLSVSGRAEHGARRLLDWLHGEARGDLEARVAAHSACLGVRAKRIVVRDQTSRWGSCSTTGVLSFSWRLVMAPPQVLDYVAAHEVAHLVEMNHGPRFWSLVEMAAPGHASAKAWLRMCGAELHRYGP